MKAPASRGQTEGLLYIAIRPVEEGSPAQYIAFQGPLPWVEVVQLVQEIASALDHAHDEGVIHGDLKAANVLLDRERGAQLSDFGLARLVSESTFSTSSGSRAGGHSTRRATFNLQATVRKRSKPCAGPQ